MHTLYAKLILIAGLSALLICAPLAHAQAQTEFSLDKYPTLDVVTVQKPDVRQHCKVKSFDATQVTCTRALAKDKTYSRSDWLTLISPLEDDRLAVSLWLGSWLSAGGACIFGAVIAASIPATAGLSLAAFLLVEIGLMGAAFSDNGPYYDTIVYQKPGTALSVKVKLEQHAQVNVVP